MTDTWPNSWSQLMKWRQECHRRFGSVQDFPIRAPGEEITNLLTPRSRVLDVGAGAHKPFHGTITELTPNYFSLDSDPEGVFDFRSFDEIPAQTTFDLILANQVLEHLSVADAFATAMSALSHLTEEGRLVVTVPNTAHPIRQWDCTHVTAWPANDLYSLLCSADFEVFSMARYNKFPLTAHPLKRWVVETVCNEFRMDWCDSIMAVAGRGSQKGGNRQSG